ncbi:NupC/NupG family nucleoside CNT transporter [Rhizomicrobium electricum]|jgi:CNT family concentrative nucleoside transporter|uniref:NupC/NupG family nucleoside CNT transporter n=1 Tax=Rhizomicrobium electricum TaxID=480070 RepID=A0ABP3PKC5_9PROT|nr:nucleoside transporter C-terminal domain-containing protein [Rhizomicrobium electricum]NIJ48574.1 CNT family concentrative nucleoside transporter [Rhizomicrobium electricum]
MVSALNLQSLAGVVLIILLCWLFSENRRRFPFLLVIGAIGVQVALVLALFGVPAIRAGLTSFGSVFDGLAKSAQTGVAFVFGFLSGAGDQPYPLTNAGALFVFGFRVLPVILLVCTLAALLWHWGILRWITKAFGFIFSRTMGLRGPTALAAAATIFMGQVEGPIVIRAYLNRLTRSELFLLITVGMACVSGSTMVAYVTILSGVLPGAAAHVLTASIISAPAGILLARILVPRDPKAEAEQEKVALNERTYSSSMDAIMKGISDGMQIAVNVAACLIVFVALVALVNAMLGALPPVGGAPVSVERVLGYVFAPVAWCLGIQPSEILPAGQLLGTKMMLTEFTAFIKLGAIPAAELTERTRIIMTYALCGFANVASVGINLAGFSVLLPERRDEIIKMVGKAMLAGFFATCLSAAIVGAVPASILGLPG